MQILWAKEDGDNALSNINWHKGFLLFTVPKDSTFRSTVPS